MTSDLLAASVDVATDAKAAGIGEYAIAPANGIDDEQLIRFAAAMWPDRTMPERILSSWWRQASPECAVVAIHRANGTVAGLCGGRPSEWVIAGRICPAVSITDWHVRADHGGKLLGRRLIRYFERPERLLNGWSISDMAVTYVRRMGWKGPFKSSMLALPLPRITRLAASVMAGRGKLDLADTAVAGDLPSQLAADLDRIEAERTHESRAHMRRGGAEWSWRLSIYRDRVYRFSVAYRNGTPVGYVVVRRATPGASRQLARLRAALITDLVALGDERAVLQALGARAAAIAAEMGAALLMFVTTAPAHRQALAALGFITSGFPLLGTLLERRAPVYMWWPRGPGATLTAEGVTMTFADSALDLDL
jgi:hypothetical protein